MTLHAVGATTVRVRLSRVGQDAVSLQLADTTGRPVASVDSLVLRPVSPEQLRVSGDGAADSLFRVEWTPVEVPTTVSMSAADWVVLESENLDVLDVVPGTVVVDGLTPSGGVVSAGVVRAAVRRALGLVQGWLAGERFAGSRLVVVTRGLAGAAVRGLVRSAQSEHPGRFVLVDVDESVSGFDPAWLCVEEAELSVGARGVCAPRLVRSPVTDEDTALSWSSAGTVLVTGAGGQLGGVFARHLVAERGVRHLLLVGRRGAEAPGSAELTAELEALGADVRWAACDVSDRDGLERVLASVPA
ncbi:KR domain-containing protein, partial [Streptomyces coacervatus]|uniref:KR domain-containing protein n=1 Tax=Streptomyces coacervatus TaxID=647381 RepID=UPI0031E7D8E8